MENLSVSFEVDGKRLEFDGRYRLFNDLAIIPSAGDEVSLDYVHGVKITFIVTRVNHHLSSISEEILHQITISGKSI